MAKRYIKISPFYNRPSTAGPLSSARLNAINDGLDAVDLYKVDTDQVANNLITTAAGLVLDARQGKALQDQISAQNDNLGDIQFNQYNNPVDANEVVGNCICYITTSTLNAASAWSMLIQFQVANLKFQINTWESGYKKRMCVTGVWSAWTDL